MYAVSAPLRKQHAKRKIRRHLDQLRQLENLIETLSDLRVQEKRSEYFDRVDSLWARGLPTDPSGLHDLEKIISRKRSGHGAAAVAQFLQRCNENVNKGYSVEQRSKLYMEMLVDFLVHRLPAGPLLGLDGV